ncbi:MAG: hypothetical protein HND51_21370 [Chloroflexi bacterium]|nr:hypothetical protein [Chloroflexota bacterium]
MTRDERIGLSGAIGEALTAFHNAVQANAPQLLRRPPWMFPENVPARLTEADEENVVDLVESDSGQEANAGFVPLNEAVVRRDGSIPIKLIGTGWGTEGYYSEEVLTRDGPEVFVEGTQMFWDHPTVTEDAERPERSLRDLAAETISPARFDANGAEGPGLYAEAKVFEGYREEVDELAPHIGLSILALGRKQIGEAEGRTGPIITEIVKARSVDFVTKAGAGGKVVELFEAARGQGTDGAEGNLASSAKPNVDTPRPKADPKTEKGDPPMADEKELQEAQEKQAAAEKLAEEAAAENARLKEAQMLREAKDCATEKLAKLEMPDVTRKRLVESLSSNPPATDEGMLDKEKFQEAIDETLKEEAEYLQEVSGSGQITGMGEAASTDTTPKDEDAALEEIEESLQESFEAMDMPESAAKIAAGGRR